MANNINFINSIVLFVPNDSIVTIKPHSLTSRSHKILPSTKTFNKQSSNSYGYQSNKDGYKMEFKKTSSTSSTMTARNKGSNSIKGKKRKTMLTSNRSTKMSCKKRSYNKLSTSSSEYVSVKKSYSRTGHLSNKAYGKVAYEKNEYKSSTTVKVMDKGGYTKYSKQERVTRVNYGYNKSGTGIRSSKGNNKSGGAKK